MWDRPHICGQHPDSRGRAGLPSQCLLHGAQEAGLDLPQLCLRHLELLQALLHLGRKRLTSGQEPYQPSQVPRLQPGQASPAQLAGPFTSPDQHPYLCWFPQCLPSPSSHTLALLQLTAYTQLPHPQKAPFWRKRPTHFLLLAPSQLPASLVPSTSLKSGLDDSFLLSHHN